MRDKIIVSIYNDKSIEIYCKNLDFYNWEELKSELLIQLFKMNESKLTDYYKKNCLIYVCFTIIKRIKYGTISDTGLFSTKDENLEFMDDFYKNVSISDVPEQISEETYNKLESELRNLHWYSKILFEMYYNDKLTLKQISEKTGINLKSVHYSIKQTRLKLKKKLLE
jgi:hypothetical protein